MLHILLLILKILGIAVLVIIALILALAAVLILSPFRYHIRASSDGSFSSARGRAEFSWLFRLISAEASYEEGELEWRLRAAWKHFSGGDDGKEETPGKTGRNAAGNSGGEQAGGAGGNGREEAVSGCRPDPAQKLSERKQDKPEKEAEKQETDRKEKHRAGARKAAPVSDEKPRSDTWMEKLRKRIEKIKYTFRQFCGKIKALMRKKERLQRFISNEVHRQAFSRVIRETKRLLSFLRPKQLEAEVVFGMEDPAETGYILALISMIYPMIGEYTVIRPDFEHKVLKGKIEAEGKIKILYMLIPAWNLVWNKSVRTTFRHIKKFRL